MLTAGLDLTSAQMATVNGQPVQGQQPDQAVQLPQQLGPPSAPNAAANVHAASNAYAILGARIACMLHTPRGSPGQEPNNCSLSLNFMPCHALLMAASAMLRSF